MDFLIKNCKAEDFEYACPKLWSELKPAFSATVRHCDHCNRKVYLCRNDTDIKFYSSVNFCVAIVDADTEVEQIRRESNENIKKAGPENEPDPKVRFMGVYVQTARKLARSINQNDIPAFLKKSAPGGGEEK